MDDEMVVMNQRMGRVRKRVAIVSVYAKSIPAFRGDLIKAMIRGECDVFVLASDYDDDTMEAVRALGAVPVAYAMARAGMNPLHDMRNTLALSSKLRALNLDLVFCYFIKPVIFGSIAAWMARIPNRFAMIEGAGYVFTETEERSLPRAVLRRAVSFLYRLGLSRVKRVFMLNPDDAKLFVGEGMVTASKVVVLNGIGLDLDYYQEEPPASRPAEDLCFLLIGRLLREKGVYDFVSAARVVKELHPATRFVLLGSVDENPGAISQNEVQDWVDAGVIEWPGQVPDVRKWIKNSSVFVLPSYREGLPRSTQEAMALGRPVITTDVPGCRETVVDQLNGFLVPVRDPGALANAMLEFIEKPELLTRMGSASRDIAEKKFDVHKVNSIILGEMGIV